jgi:hypothetical protein
MDSERAKIFDLIEWALADLEVRDQLHRAILLFLAQAEK